MTTVIPAIMPIITATKVNCTASASGTPCPPTSGGGPGLMVVIGLIIVGCIILAASMISCVRDAAKQRNIDNMLEAGRREEAEFDARRQRDRLRRIEATVSVGPYRAPLSFAHSVYAIRGTRDVNRERVTGVVMPAPPRYVLPPSYQRIHRVEEWLPPYSVMKDGSDGMMTAEESTGSAIRLNSL